MAKSNRSNDAWASIRGFVYQVQLSVQHWINLNENQYLELESVEDIDIVTQKLVESNGSLTKEELTKLLGQVKHLDKPISLRSDAFKEAIINFYENTVANRSEGHKLLFLTNAKIGSEQKVAFYDNTGGKINGLQAWKHIQENQPLGEEAIALVKIQEIIGEVAPVKYKNRQERWRSFKRYFLGENCKAFIQKIIISSNNPSPQDLKQELIESLSEKFHRSPSESELLYNKLFTKVFEVISLKDTEKKGHKTVFSQDSLREIQRAEFEVLFDAKIANTVKHLFSTVHQQLAVISDKQDLLLNNDQVMAVALAEIDRKINTNDNAISIINDLLNQIEKDIAALKLRECYSALGKLETTIEPSNITQPIKNEILARIYFLKGLSIHTGQECIELPGELFKKAFRTNSKEIRYMEKAGWTSLLEGDDESAQWIADQLLMIDSLNFYGLLIKERFDQASILPPLIKKDPNFKRLQFIRRIIQHQTSHTPFDWKHLLDQVDEEDFNQLKITADNNCIPYWRIVALGLLAEIFSSPVHFQTTDEIRKCFRPGGFDKFVKVVKALYLFLWNHQALTLRNEYIEIHWLHAIVEFLTHDSKEYLREAATIIETMNAEEDKRTKAFNIAFFCYAARDWPLVIQLSDQYQLDKASIIGPIRLISLLNLGSPAKAKSEAQEIIERIKEIDIYSFNVLYLALSCFSACHEDPFPIANDAWRDIQSDSHGYKELLLAWAYYCGMANRTVQVNYDLASALESVKAKHWAPTQRIWIAEMDAKGYGRYDLAKASLEEILKMEPFKNDPQLWARYYQYWFQSDQSKADLLAQLEMRRKAFNDFSSITLEFKLLAIYRKYNELIDLCWQELPEVTNESKFELIYFVAEEIHQNAPDKYESIIPLFTEDLIGCLLPIEKKINLSKILGESGRLPLAIKMLYEEIKKTSSPIAKLHYISLWTLDMNSELINLHDYKHLEKITSDCVVKLFDERDREFHLVVLTPESKEKKDLQERLIGKELGDTIEPKQMVGSKIKLTVSAIFGKYLGLNDLILEERRKDKTSEIPMVIGEVNPDDIPGTLEKMMEMYGGKEEIRINNNHRADLFKSFESRTISFMELVIALDKNSPIELYETLTNRSEHHFPCLLTPDKVNGLTSDIKLVLDFTTLIPLYKYYHKFEILPINALVVSQTMVDFIKRKIHHLSRSKNERGSLFFTDNGPEYVSYPADFDQRRKEYYESLLTWIQTHCLIEYSFHTGDLLLHIHQKGNEKTVDLPHLAYMIDTMVLSERENHLLLTDDLFFSKYFKKPFIPLQTIFRQELYQGNATREQLLYDLLDCNYIGIYPDKALFMEAAERHEVTSGSGPLSNLYESALFYKAGPVLFLEFMKPIQTHPNFTNEKKRNEVVRIFSFLIDHYQNPNNQLKDLLMWKLYFDFIEFPEQFNTIYEIFEQEWNRRFP